MTFIKLPLLIFLLVFLTICSFLAGQKYNYNSSSPSEHDAHDAEIFDLLTAIKNRKIENILTWNMDNGKSYFGYVRQFDEQCKDKDLILDSCQKLFIYDEFGKIVFEKFDVAISFQIIELKEESFQILMTTNGGGTDSFLEIVEYKKGKFSEILDEATGQQMRGGWWKMPEYRSNNSAPYFKPLQIIVIQQQGGADENPDAAILRYRNNRFNLAGTIKMQTLGDFIEKQIADNKK